MFWRIISSLKGRVSASFWLHSLSLLSSFWFPCLFRLFLLDFSLRFSDIFNRISGTDPLQRLEKWFPKTPLKLFELKTPYDILLAHFHWCGTFHGALIWGNPVSLRFVLSQSDLKKVGAGICALRRPVHAQNPSGSFWLQSVPQLSHLRAWLMCFI